MADKHYFKVTVFPFILVTQRHICEFFQTANYSGSIVPYGSDGTHNLEKNNNHVILQVVGTIWKIRLYWLTQNFPTQTVPAPPLEETTAFHRLYAFLFLSKYHWSHEM